MTMPHSGTTSYSTVLVTIALLASGCGGAASPPYHQRTHHRAGTCLTQGTLGSPGHDQRICTWGQ